MKTNKITKILATGVSVVLVALVASSVFNAENEPEKEQMIQRNKEVQSSNATTSTESLRKISNSSDVESDLDLYIESTETMPNPNDFNDSYSDLNR